jgi:Family of unknown function (DUF5808)
MELGLKFGGIEVEIKGLGGIITLVGIFLIGASIIKELMRPPNERTWHGRLAGAVPYDFRPPTFERLKANVWNPDDARVLTDKTFGVGWDVNLGAVARKTGLPV